MAAKIVHEQLLSSVFKLPSAFFDQTPIGRLLSRFGFDVDVLDSKLPHLIGDWVVCSVEV